jgi:hypothetical protein
MVWEFIARRSDWDRGKHYLYQGVVINALVIVAQSTPLCFAHCTTGSIHYTRNLLNAEFKLPSTRRSDASIKKSVFYYEL